MKPFQERVVAEKAELEEKIEKLQTFFCSDDFLNVDPGERSRMIKQYLHMIRYELVLGDRIAHFK